MLPSFQYPQSDRSSFNFAPSAPREAGASFSIRSRIVHRSTPLTQAVGQKEKIFQYPQSDRSSFNKLDEIDGNDVVNFQYPQSDRSSFNFSHQRQRASRLSPFSIRSRIVHRSTRC